MNKVRCMLNESCLPSKFWAKAASTACYLINLSPSSAIDFMVPEHKWSKKKPTYKHLKTFGCVVFIHTNQGKLSRRAKKEVFLGSPNVVKGYKVWLLDDLKCVISTDVIFNECEFYKTNKLVKGSANTKQVAQSFMDRDEQQIHKTNANQDEGGLNHHTPKGFYEIHQN
ncbi:uncharacterized mitochondrial protein AtMg00710-like [Henckelia pumila]|uniref:uncharacterized mitochondrial protein AtMg00710-like n=1 Tax=Henckelia pumila TaxID=405737 RepID=UPI003C6DBEC9